MPDVCGSADIGLLRREPKLTMLQARVPAPLYAAAKARLEQDGVSWRQFVRWALVQYLALQNNKSADKVWNEYF